ncbi:GvpL/GvpF family gas vesicle protein [Rhodococcus sp. Z13]|uniref:GvpL/GvpF family gas vesicle protein n=1 Tax=Rhodococcus sacchari TaxID=2962047 RepID=A0ACD4DG44_9NOCA|nr:GvpL/GvpF family gas vesicle protein [Rhodococcus sp. Z13]UYP18972.1 GvpL/GvpF family gas vesicle protein [Rhodococcus sp. Z13]
MTDTTGIWMYAVTEAGHTADLVSTATGVAGERVRVIGEDGLTAVVGTVPLAEFGADALTRNLEDLGWLERVARAHDAVVSTLGRRIPVIPLRLATVCLDEHRVHEILMQHRREFTEALTLVTGRTEWGVKAFADRKTLSEALTDANTGDAAGGSGTAYLLRRRAQLAARESVEREAAARADDIHERLLHRAAAGRRNPPTDPALSGNPEWMLLNGSYLVDDEAADEFRSEVEDLGKSFAGIRVELTGPWPPYSFAGAERIAP